MSIKIKSIYIIFLLISYLGLAQNRLFIDHADVQNIIQKNKIMLNGNVAIRIDTMKLFCDRAVIFKNTNKIECSGNVIIHNGPNSTIVSDLLDYSEKKALIKFFGNVFYTNPDFKTQSDTLYYYNQTKNYDLIGRASVYNKIENSKTKAKKILKRDSLFWAINDAEHHLLNDSSSLFADSLQFNMTKKNAFAKINVKLQFKAMQALSEFAELNQKDSVIILSKNPQIRYDSKQIKGDSIFLIMKNNELRKLDVHGNAYSYELLDSVSQKANEIKGQRIVMLFKDQALHEIFAAYQSKALYYFDADAADQGINYVSSDSIRITFKEKELHEITVFGAAEGTYYPADYKGAIKEDD